MVAVGTLLYDAACRWKRRRALRVIINVDLKLYETKEGCVENREGEAVATLPADSVACLDREVCFTIGQIESPHDERSFPHQLFGSAVCDHLPGFALHTGRLKITRIRLLLPRKCFNQ